MTVGRYIKKPGYADLRGIKDELRVSSVGEPLLAHAGSHIAFAEASPRAKIKGLEDVHTIPNSSDWPRIVFLIASASRVYVASFQVGRFMGLGFANFPQTLRPGVYFSDGSDGSYADVLLEPDPSVCLVLIDFRRYSRHFRLLAEAAAARNVPTVILTDVHCHWVRSMTDNVVMIETDVGVRSLSMAQLLFELLLAAVAAKLKDTEPRAARVFDLRPKFIGFVGSDDSRRRPKG